MMTPTPAEAAALLREQAQRHGFSRAAIASVEPLPRHALYQRWLDADLAGEMTYLRADAAARADVRALLATARSVLCVALPYYHPTPEADGGGVRGQIARYARGEDYHLVLKQRLGALAVALAERLGRPLACRVCVDSAPIMERELGERAGLGFVGKHTLLITPGLGSYTVLGEILLDVEAAPGGAEEPRCGACRLCLDACPTGAIIDEYRLDARRCISYLTIELRGAIPRALRPLMGTWVFGCDRCQEVCPWNAAERVGDAALRPRSGAHALPELVALLGLGAAQFRRFVKRTALRRIHRAQLLRNAAVALGNAGTAAEVPALDQALDEDAPLIRGHAAWALGAIGLRHPEARAIAAAALQRRLAQEPDAEVREELRAALGPLL